MIGKKFSRLKVIAKDRDHVSPSGKKRPKWLCKCECGTTKSVLQQNLKNGKTTSCGCYAKERATGVHTKHGNNKKNSRSSEYTSWAAMHARCKKHKDYKKKRIEVCKEWSDFEVFLKDMGTKPKSSYTIDRIDNNKGYYKENCRWATKQTQLINRDCKSKTGHKNIAVSKEGTYLVRITRDYKVNYVGTFKTIEEAIKARDRWLSNYKK